MDEWGKDPEVRRIRKIFSGMEKMDATILKDAGLSPFDQRLRKARDLRRKLYEAVYGRALSKGRALKDPSPWVLFEQCQVAAFMECGLPVPETRQAARPEITALIREVLG